MFIVPTCCDTFQIQVPSHVSKEPKVSSLELLIIITCNQTMIGAGFLRGRPTHAAVEPYWFLSALSLDFPSNVCLSRQKFEEAFADRSVRSVINQLNMYKIGIRGGSLRWFVCVERSEKRILARFLRGGAVRCRREDVKSVQPNNTVMKRYDGTIVVGRAIRGGRSLRTTK